MDKLKKKMDLESIDELIGLCEDRMVSPFKKKKPDAVALVVEDEEEEHDEGEDKPDLEDMDMDDLIRMYEEMKSKKSEEE